MAPFQMSSAHARTALTHHAEIPLTFRGLRAAQAAPPNIAEQGEEWLFKKARRVHEFGVGYTPLHELGDTTMIASKLTHALAFQVVLLRLCMQMAVKSTASSTVTALVGRSKR